MAIILYRLTPLAQADPQLEIEDEYHRFDLNTFVKEAQHRAETMQWIQGSVRTMQIMSIANQYHQGMLPLEKYRECIYRYEHGLPIFDN